MPFPNYYNAVKNKITIEIKSSKDIPSFVKLSNEHNLIKIVDVAVSTELF